LTHSRCARSRCFPECGNSSVLRSRYSFVSSSVVFIENIVPPPSPIEIRFRLRLAECTGAAIYWAIDCIAIGISSRIDAYVRVACNLLKSLFRLSRLSILSSTYIYIYIPASISTRNFWLIRTIQHDRNPEGRRENMRALRPRRCGFLIRRFRRRVGTIFMCLHVILCLYNVYTILCIQYFTYSIDTYIF